MTPSVLLWTCRVEEGQVLCGEGHKGRHGGLLSRPLLSPVLLVRNTNNLLDLQEGDKRTALVSVMGAPPREEGGFCCTFSPSVPVLNPSQHPLGVTCQELGQARQGGDRAPHCMGR